MLSFFKSPSRPALLIEFTLLCAVLPTIIIAFKLAPFMFAFLWAATGYALIVYLQSQDNPKLRFLELWKPEAVTTRALKPILLRWVVCCAGMIVLTLLIDPDRLFALVQERPAFVLMLFLMYPVLSALPQEFIFCSFFFSRYAPFFKSERAMILASATTFAYAHMLFINWVAPTLSLLAGFIFAHTYAKTKSLALVTLEHTLYGNFLFAVGLGWYFYSGSVAQ